MDTGMLIYPATMFVLALVLFLARILFPSLKNFKKPARSFEELQKEYAKWDFYFALLYLPAIALCGAAALWLLVKASAWRYAAFTGDWVLTPGIWMWVLPAIPAALGCAGILVEAMARRLLGERVAEYQGYESLKYGLDTTRLTKPAVLICLTLSAVIAFLLMDYYVLVDRRGVTVDRLFALGERVYGYDDVVGVETWTRRFDTKSEARMQVFFRDGTSWESRWSPRDLRDEDVRALSALIAMRAGVPVREVPKRE